MKLSTLMFADYASLREGTLGIMGGFVNQLWRPSYPSPINAHIVAAATTTDEHLTQQSISMAFRFRLFEAGTDETVIEGQGRLDAQIEDSFESVFPMIFDVSQVVIPNPGEYVLQFDLADSLSETVRLRANLSAVTD